MLHGLGICALGLCEGNSHLTGVVFKFNVMKSLLLGAPRLRQAVASSKLLAGIVFTQHVRVRARNFDQVMSEYDGAT